jgi:hypothetical protein
MPGKCFKSWWFYERGLREKVLTESLIARYMRRRAQQDLKL